MVTLPTSVNNEHTFNNPCLFAVLIHQNHTFKIHIETLHYIIGAIMLATAAKV